AYTRFRELLPAEQREAALSARLPKSCVLELPELRVRAGPGRGSRPSPQGCHPDPRLRRQANPFRHRICRVFSTAEDGSNGLSFEDFLDMLSVFSESATSEIKAHYAFHIFDFNDDGILDKKDLENLVNCLTGQSEESRLSDAEMEQLIKNILEESDIDKDGTINFCEFQHVVSRSPDFARYCGGLR
ncbi:CIB1 protein, partial [Nothocercus nigrocapillus]|nr:CIB1 protein [Nothocercus nigrocapillus]